MFEIFRVSPVDTNYDKRVCRALVGAAIQCNVCVFQFSCLYNIPDLTT